MIARIQKSMAEKDKGFTLIELLVVIIIIGILSAIAIPIFLNQRKKAVDAAAEADLTTIAKQVATAYTDSDATVTVDATTNAGSYTLKQGTTTEVIGPVSGKLGTVSVNVGGTSASDFTVELTYENGDKSPRTYSAVTGLSD